MSKEVIVTIKQNSVFIIMSKEVMVTNKQNRIFKTMFEEVIAILFPSSPVARGEILLTLELRLTPGSIVHPP